MRTVGIGAKTNAADDIETLKAKLAEVTEYAKARDKEIETLKAKLAEAEKPTKSPEKGKQ